MDEITQASSPEPPPPPPPPSGPIQIVVSVASALDAMLCPIVHHLSPPAIEHMRIKAGEEVTAMRQRMMQLEQQNDQLQAENERLKGGGT